MKKLFSVVIIILCASMLTMSFSAAETPDAYALYKLATKHMKEASSLETISAAKEVFQFTGEAPEAFTVTTTSKKIKSPDGTLQMEEHISRDPEGPYTSLDTYCKDGYIYTRGYNYKYKSKIKTDSKTEIITYETLTSVHDLGLDIPQQYLKDLTAETLPGGGYRLRFVTDGSENGYMHISDTICVLTLNSDARLETMACTYSVTLIDNGEVYLKSKGRMGTRVLSVNKPLKINFPPDLDTYVEQK